MKRIGVAAGRRTISPGRATPVHQRDFILRIIEQLGAVLAELRRMILGRGDPAETQEALSRAASMAGFDLELLRGFDTSTLHLLVSPLGEVDPTRCWMMAEILYLDGLEAELRDGSGRASLLKARALYDLVRPSGGMLVGMPEATERIAEIDERLGGTPVVTD
jgi:hypothetical protein